MNDIQFKKTDLLAIIRANRDNHKSVFEEALANYRAKAIEVLDKHIAEARAGGRIYSSLGLVRPQDMTDSYDTVIRMLEMAIDENISLTYQEFQQYVRDKWVWREQFNNSNRSYVTSQKALDYLEGKEIDE